MGLFKPDINRLKEEGNYAELLRCLDSKKAGVRYSAFVALSDRADGDVTVSEKLKKMAGDSDVRIRTLAALKFAGPGDPLLSKTMLEVMEDGTNDDKIKLLYVVSGMGATSDETVIEVIVRGLLDKNETVKLQAIRAAGRVKSTHLVSNLGELVHARHHKIRFFIAGALNEIGGEEAVDCLIGLLADSDHEVQAAARMYLEKSPFEYAQKAIHDAEFMLLVKGMHDREPVRKMTAEKIGNEKIREGLALLHRACRDKYREVRIAALKSMAVFRNQGSIEAASRLMDDRYHDVRIEAINTLEKIGGINAIRAVEKGLVDGSGEVRRAAEHALEKMNKFL